MLPGKTVNNQSSNNYIMNHRHLIVSRLFAQSDCASARASHFIVNQTNFNEQYTTPYLSKSSN